ncbi:MAG: tetratricopeptide repeat protein [Planctomycetes bacterium]|nr:tetratricopeptide repeat protein [Planctomycetota bacterium]
MKSTGIIRTGAFLFLLAFICSASASAASKNDADELYERNIKEGAALLREGKHPQAIARFKFARKHKPEGAEVYYWLGLADSDLKQYVQAAANAEKATLLRKNMPEAWLLWGQSLMYLHKWEDALSKLDQAHRMDPDNPLITFTIGRCYYHGYDNKNHALDFFKKTLSLGEHKKVANLDEIKQQARIYAGSCYLAKDLPQMAIKTYAEVLKRDKSNTEALFRIGLAYRSLEYYTDAAKAFQEVIKRDPQNFEAHLQLGHLYLTYLPDPELAKYHLIRFYNLVQPKTHPWRVKIYNYYVKKKEEGTGDDAGKADGETADKKKDDASLDKKSADSAPDSLPPPPKID